MFRDNDKGGTFYSFDIKSRANALSYLSLSSTQTTKEQNRKSPVAEITDIFT